VNPLTQSEDAELGSGLPRSERLGFVASHPAVDGRYSAPDMGRDRAQAVAVLEVGAGDCRRVLRARDEIGERPRWRAKRRARVLRVCLHKPKPGCDKALVPVDESMAWRRKVLFALDVLEVAPTCLLPALTEVKEQLLAGEEACWSSPDRRGVARPAPVIEAGADSGRERVANDVADGSEQVSVLLHKARAEAPLEEVAVAAVATVERLGVDAIQLPHGAGEVRVRRLDEQVIVVVHQTVGEHVQAVAADDEPSNSRKRSRSASSAKIARRSSPRATTW